MAQLPKITGSLSSATKLKFSNIESSLVEMLHQLVVSDDFANLDAWTEVDADAKLNLSGGVITIDGGNSYGTHGIYYTAGFARAAGYFEIKFSIPGTVANAGNMQISNTGAVPAALAAGNISSNILSLTLAPYVATSTINASTIVADTYYTIRMHTGLSADGTSWKAIRFTIQGGIYLTETEISCAKQIATELAATIYFVLQRYSSSGANPVSFKEFRWYSGYATDAPYVEYVHDAGAGKVFDNFDPSALAMPGTVPSTNLTFKWSFDDGTPSYSSALTLAQLNAVGKQTARHRYIRIQVLLNSDGATQIYADKPNSDTATDGVGDFPEVGNVRPPDTVQGTTGDLSNLVATDAAYVALEETRNTDLSATLVVAPTAYTDRGVAKEGSYAVAASSVPTIEAIDHVTASSAIMHVDFTANAASYKIYKDGTLLASGVTDKDYNLTGLAANTTYSITVKGTNSAGTDSAASAAVTVTTLASGAATDVALISSTTIAVVDVSGYPKIVGSGTAKVFDPRVIANAISQDTADYYWKDIQENSGRAVLPC